ncbi:MAG: hypothetical protein AAFX07_00540 [Pseudomonadota bacterium]
MTLTLPQSGRRPGRIASVTPIEGGQVAAAAAQLGNVAANVGQRVEQERLTHQSQRARVDYAKELGELRLAVDQVGDPDDKDARWTEGVGDIRNRYLGEQSQLDPRVRRDLDAAFDDLANSHALQVGQSVLAGRRARREAMWIEHSADIATQAASVDGETRDTLLDQAAAMLADRVASGDIDEAQSITLLRNLIGEVDNAAAIGLIGRDAEAFIAAQDAGVFASLGPEANARYRNQAETAIASAEKDARTAEEKAERDRQKAIGDRLGEMADIYSKGRAPIDEVWLQQPEVQAHEDFGRVMAAKRLREQGVEILSMTPAQIQAEINAERERPVVFRYQTEYLELLEAQLTEAEEAWSSDPIEAARARLGEQVPELPLQGDPGDLAGALVQRTFLSDQLERDGFIDGPAILSDAEKAQLAEAIGIEADPAERARLAGEMARGLRGRPGFLAALSGDPVFQQIGSLLAAGGSPRVAEEVFRGQQVIESKTALLPPIADRTEAAFLELGALMADVPGGEQRQAAMVAAADALYARRKRLTDPTDDIDEDAYRQAMHEVMGGSGTYDARDAQGGVQEVRGQLTFMPVGVNARSVETALDTIGRRGEASSRGRTVQRDNADALASQLEAISLSGNLPTIGTKPLDHDVLDELELKAIGGDAYVFVFRSRVGERVVTDSDGGEYVFSLRRLLREVRQ